MSPAAGGMTMGILLMAWACHLVLVQLVAFPWWTPDLTTIGMVAAIGRSPSRWWQPAGVAGLLAALWAVRMPGVMYGAVFAVGALVRLSAGEWNAADARVQAVQAAGAVAILATAACWIDGAWSWALPGLILGKALLSGFTLFLVRRWMSRRVRLPA